MRARHAPRTSQTHTVSEPVSELNRQHARTRLMRAILEFILYLFKYSIMSPQAY